MGAGIAANPHYPVSFHASPCRFIPVRLSCDRQPAKWCAPARAGTIRRRFGRPPFGGRPHLESPSSSRHRVCRNSRFSSDGLLSCPIGFASTRGNRCVPWSGHRMTSSSIWPVLFRL